MVTQVDGGRTSAPAHDRSATWPLANPLRATALAVAALVLGTPAVATASPAGEAMTEFKDGKMQPDAVQNRFFLKEGRFEIEPFGGYVPNNPFARRYVFGANFGYHLKESLGFTGMVSYSPDLIEGDLKGLTQTLVQIAETGTGTAAFQQPLDKVTLAASFAVLWSPFYGKINLFGEQVVNFDFYATAGLGMVSKVDYYATYDDSGADGNFVAVAEYGNEVKFSPNIGLGANFFVTGSVAIKIDARFLMFFDNKPQYDPNETVTESRLYNNFVASVGPAFFFPAMKPRIYDF